MTKQTALAYYVSLGKRGTKSDVKNLMSKLNRKMTLADSKFIDFALGQVVTNEGVAVIQHYLFHGTQIQRNYCTLYFARLEE